MSLVLIALLLVLAVALVSLGPSLLSTEPGRRWLQGRVNARLVGRVELGQLHLRWFDPLWAEGVELTNADGDQVVGVDRIDCPIGLYALLVGNDPIELIRARGVTLNITSYEDGSYGFGDIVRPGPTPSGADEADPTEALPRLLKIDIGGGVIRLVRHDGDTVQINDIELQANRSADRMITFALAGTVGGEQAAAERAGLVRVAGQVNPTGTMTYSLKGPLQVMERIPITQGLSTIILSQLNPAVFYEPTSISGTVSVSITDAYIPLTGDTLAGAYVASGRLDFTGLRIQPRRDTVLGSILALAGLATGDRLGAEIPGVAFRVRDGRVYYDDFKVIWSKAYHMKFAGSVGADNTVDMTVSLPITPDLLIRLLQIKHQPRIVKRLAALLAGQYVTLTIGGTRQHPTLDVLGVRKSLQGLIKRSVKLPELLSSTLQDLLRDSVAPIKGALPGSAATATQRTSLSPQE